jgi:hypothetical protein
LFGQSGIGNFFWVVLFLLGLKGLKSGLMWLICWILDKDIQTWSQMRLHMNPHDTFCIAVILTAIISMMTVTQVQMYLICITFIAIGLYAIVRYVKSNVIVISLLRIKKYYFFLYLCTFEIIPVIVLVRLATEYFIST